MLSEVRKGIALNECSFEKDPTLGLGTDHPEFAAMKDWAKALAAAAILDARSGNVHRCQANLVGIQILARHSAEENSILSQLVATAISKIGLRAGDRVIGDGGAKFAPAIEAMAKAVPEIEMADCLAIECAAGVVSIRSLNLDEPFHSELKAKIDKIQEADANLSMGTIRKAFETRYLQYWVKVKKEVGTQSAEEFGKMMDRIAASEANLDATYLLNHEYTGTIHEQAGNAMASVTAKKNAALTLAAILQGSPAQSAADKFGTKVDKTAIGYTITDKSYRPPPKAVLNAYAAVYPYRGQK
jgi:hypothetical protein